MWQTIRASALGRHVHERAYAALVLSGGYEEAGDHGRFRVKASDVIFHEQFEAHLDRFCETGVVVLNLRLPVGCSYPPGIACVAERSCRDALDLLSSLAASTGRDPLVIDKVQHHTTAGYIEEDSVQALEQLV